MTTYKTNKKYHFVHQKKNRNTAGSKAPDDISRICNELGYDELVLPVFPSNKNALYVKGWLLSVALFAWMKAYRSIPTGASLIFQHPNYGMRLSMRFLRKLKEKKHCRLIAIVHDLESLRGGIAGIIKNNRKTNQIADNEFLSIFDSIICHNEHMRQYLISQGFNGDKIVNLMIFDYLTDIEPKTFDHERNPSIAIAGNLAIGKCPYIYKITNNECNKNLVIHLYGNNFDEKNLLSNMVYHGSFKPEELPQHLEGKFGLVWDGTEADTCAGNTGEYLKYNNPHKTSLYLSAGMPVIVWAKAAIAEFITQNKAGITVDSLYELEKRISEIEPNQYSELVENARIISQRLRDGYYTKEAIRKALEIVGQ